jgi:hypothetical protein
MRSIIEMQCSRFIGNVPVTYVIVWRVNSEHEPAACVFPGYYVYFLFSQIRRTNIFYVVTQCRNLGKTNVGGSVCGL